MATANIPQSPDLSVSAEDRRQFLGASDMGALLGVDPYRTALDVYEEKVGLAAPFLGNQHTRRGTQLEAIAVTEWVETQPPVYRMVGSESAMAPIKVARVNQRFVHPVYPFITGRIDRRVVGEKRIVEVKCPSLGSYHRIKRTGLHEGYIVQMQTYLGLTGSEAGHWVIFCADQWEVCAFPVEFDAILYNQIIDRAVRFWEDHVVPRVPPSPNAVDAERIEIARAEGEVPRINMQESAAFTEAAGMLRDAKQLAAEAALLEAEARKRLLGVIEPLGIPGGAAVYVAPGFRVSYATAKGRAAFDKTALARADPIDRLQLALVCADHQVPADVVEDLTRCRLDLSQFDKPGRPYAVLRLTTPHAQE